MIPVSYTYRPLAPAAKAEGATLRRGFTLIELMLAITIFAMVASVVFSAFRVGISAWQGGERDIVFHQSMRATAELLFREISGTHPYKITPGTMDVHRDFPAFFGSPDSLLFVSNAPLQNRIGGVSLIEFWVDDDQGLMLGEAPALFTSYEEMREVNLRDDAQVLSSWVKKIAFRYFQREGTEDDGVWLEQWDPLNIQGQGQSQDLPMMVEVWLLFEDVRGQEIEQTLLVPIRSQPF